MLYQFRIQFAVTQQILIGRQQFGVNKDFIGELCVAFAGLAKLWAALHELHQHQLLALAAEEDDVSY